MRVAFKNNAGGIMLVDESRVNEYKAAGFKPVANVENKKNVEVVEEEKPAVKKRRKKEV